MKSLLLLSIALNIILSPVAFANDISATQQTKIMEINQLLQQHPDVIEDLHLSLNHYIDQKQTIGYTLKQHHDYLYNNPQQPYFGAENPILTIINFTDYNCPYCKRLEPGLIEVLKQYPEVRVVNILLPFQQKIIAELKTNTAWYALNVWQNNRSQYAEVHRLMMAKPSTHDNISLLKIAQRTNTQNALNPSKEHQDLVEKNEFIFSQLGLRGTPSLIIGDQIIPGYIPVEQLKQEIDNQLNKLKSVRL